MKYLFLFLFLSMSLSSHCQYTFCDSINVNVDYSLFERTKIKTVQDFLAWKYPRLSTYKANRFELTELRLLYNEDDTMIFGDTKDFDIRVKFEKTPVNGSAFFVASPMPNRLGSQPKEPSTTPFGLYPFDTCVKTIKSISFNSVMLPDSIFNDLLNVNQFATSLSIRPVEVYPSEDGSHIYIYLFGELKNSELISSDPYTFSYMCKIILTKEGSYVGRIVESGKVLRYFGFDRCPLFIGY